MVKRGKKIEVQVNTTVIQVTAKDVEEALRKALTNFKSSFGNGNKTEEPIYLIKIKSVKDALN